ncbi:MAG: YfcE family phosphodiesterase [Halobacteriaceae archaeon]
MRVGILSDTHDNVEAIRAATDLFAQQDVVEVVHCGDLVAPPVVDFFEGFTLHAVIGNNDGELDGLDRAIRSLGGDSALHGRFADLEFDGVRVAVLHGEDRDHVEEVATGDYDVVCYGHHHEAERHEVGDTTVLNPGAHFPTVPDSERSVAVLDTVAEAVEFHDL